MHFRNTPSRTVILPRRIPAVAAGPVVAFSQINSGSGFTFTNSDLTVENSSGSAGLGSAVSTVSVAGGKRYFEAHFDVNSGVGYATVGFASTSFSPTGIGLGDDTGSASFGYRANGAMRINNGGLTPQASYAVTDTVHIAVDFTVSPAQIYVGSNGSWGGGDPAAGTGGLSLTGLAAGPYWAAVGTFIGDKWTGNFGTSVYLPSTYSTWST